jgi:type III secretion system FlhB-like substrate exporter
MRICLCLILFGIIATLSGCETFSRPVTSQNIRGKSDSIAMNANRRAVYFLWVENKSDPHQNRKPDDTGEGEEDVDRRSEKDIGRYYMVSEPPPDTALASTVSALAKLSADIPKQSGSGEGKLDVTQSIVQIARTTSVTLLRDTLFRLAEAYANGAIDSAQFEKLYAKVVDSIIDLAEQETTQKLVQLEIERQKTIQGVVSIPGLSDQQRNMLLDQATSPTAVILSETKDVTDTNKNPT